MSLMCILNNVIKYIYIICNMYVYIYIRFFSGNMERQKTTPKRKRSISKKENYMTF